MNLVKFKKRKKSGKAWSLEFMGQEEVNLQEYEIFYSVNNYYLQSSGTTRCISNMNVS